MGAFVVVVVLIAYGCSFDDDFHLLLGQRQVHSRAAAAALPIDNRPVGVSFGGDQAVAGTNSAGPTNTFDCRPSRVSLALSLLYISMNFFLNSL